MKTIVCMITGASSGIGLATARQLASRGAKVILVCRDTERGERARCEVESVARGALPRLLVANLASLASVRGLAARFLREEGALHVLINNAATMSASRTTTEDGLETTFAVNYAAPFLLSHLLFDALKSNAPARIVNVASNAVRIARRLDLSNLDGARRYGALGAYKQSKLALVLFTLEFARRVRGSGVTVNCLHPGDVRTNMTARGFFIDLIRPFMSSVTADVAAEACVRLALSPDVAETSGRYFEDGTPSDCGGHARDVVAAQRLYQASLEMTRAPELYFTVPSEVASCR